jgi:hypothetical protein
LPGFHHGTYPRRHKGVVFTIGKIYFSLLLLPRCLITRFSPRHIFYFFIFLSFFEFFGRKQAFWIVLLERVKHDMPRIQNDMLKDANRERKMEEKNVG